MSATAFAAEPEAAAKARPLGDDKMGKLIRRALPACSADAKVTTEDYAKAEIPSGFAATLVRVESDHPACGSQYVSVTTNNGGHFLGTVWWLTNEPGANTAERLRGFLWRSLNQVFDPVIDKTRTPFGTYKVTLNQTTEYGKMPLTGEVDAEGRLFFFGHFRAATADVIAERNKAFEAHVAKAPSRGAPQPQVTVVEFSDFQCPACKHAKAYVDPIVEKHGDKVRYVRVDLPLLSSHPWAFPAAMAGRAIHRQKPEAFWQFKKAVYDSQDSLTAFTFDNFARGFVLDHELDIKKYDTDVNSVELKNELLSGVAAAFSNSVSSTPMYLVNGVIVDPGDDGAALASYVEKQLQ